MSDRMNLWGDTKSLDEPEAGDRAIKKVKSVRFTEEEQRVIWRVVDALTEETGIAQDFSAATRFLVMAGRIALEQGIVKIETEKEEITRIKIPRG